MSRRALHGVVAVLCFTACASVPKEAPVLSQELGTRIDETRRAHLALFRSYIELKRAIVDDFVDREWVSEFTEQVFASPAVAGEWERVLRGDDTDERTEFLVGLGKRLTSKIEAKRRELQAPLDEAEEIVVGHLEQHYDQMHIMNLTVTTLLERQAEATEIEARFSEDDLGPLLDKVDELVSLITANRDAAEEDKEGIKDLLDAMRKGTEKDE